MRFAINHMTAPNLAWRDLLILANEVGASGIEYRNDLSTPLFSGEDATVVGRAVTQSGLEFYGLSQVYPFNAFDTKISDEVERLIETAKICGAQTISLIPRNDGLGRGNGERQANLRIALREIKPMLEDVGLVALVEPLGFERSSLRYKKEAINAIEGVNGGHVFKIVHDTFHHYLAQETEFYPEHTGMVHVSGVVDTSLSITEMEDDHRVLVDEEDRLGNIAQLKTLNDLGYEGPISMESFSPEIHKITDITELLKGSLDFIKSALNDKQDVLISG